MASNPQITYKASSYAIILRNFLTRHLENDLALGSLCFKFFISLSRNGSIRCQTRARDMSLIQRNSYLDGVCIFILGIDDDLFNKALVHITDDLTL